MHSKFAGPGSSKPARYSGVGLNRQAGKQGQWERTHGAGVHVFVGHSIGALYSFLTQEGGRMEEREVRQAWSTAGTIAS